MKTVVITAFIKGVTNKKGIYLCSLTSAFRRGKGKRRESQSSRGRFFLVSCQTRVGLVGERRYGDGSVGIRGR